MNRDCRSDGNGTATRGVGLAWAIRSDADLMHLASEGDFGAFSELLVRHTSRIYDFTQGILGNDEASLQVVCDACVLAYLYLGYADEALDATTWFHLNTVRALITHLEKRQEPKLVDTPVMAAPHGLNGAA
jgi:DNA-directed RNA polymerase specialized sigma24 family protein